MPRKKLSYFTGVNNRERLTSKVFAPSKEGMKLAEASNVLFTDDFEIAGFPSAIITGNQASSLFSSNIGLIAQAGTTIVQNPQTANPVTLVSGLSGSRVHFHQYNDQVLWTDGTAKGRILSDGTAVNWGCTTTPTPALSSAVGTLDAGRYLVAVTVVDAQGIEHTCDEAGVITLGQDQSIVVQASLDLHTAFARIWCSRKDGQELYFVANVGIDALPVTINDVEVSDEPLRTQFMLPPIPGRGIFSQRGWVMTFEENFIFVSDGVNAHVFNPEFFEARPYAIQGAQGLESGFWVACERGLFWTQTGGDSPAEWVTTQKDNRDYAFGSAKYPGYLLPTLNASSDVALFASSEGLVVGMPNGELIPAIMQDIRWDVEGKRASFALLHDDVYNHVIVSLNEV
jgi:hypothetical protein